MLTMVALDHSKKLSVVIGGTRNPRQRAYERNTDKGKGNGMDLRGSYGAGKRMPDYLLQTRSSSGA